MSQMPEGWAAVFSARKYHYFIAGRSLCGKWMTVAVDLEPDDGPHPDDCTPCRRALDKANAS